MTSMLDKIKEELKKSSLTSPTAGLVIPASENDVTENSALNQQTYTITEAAKAAERSEKAIQLAIYEKRLKATKVDGEWQINQEDLDTYVQRSKNRSKKTYDLSDPGPFTAYAAGKILGKEPYGLITSGRLKAEKTEHGWEVTKEAIEEYMQKYDNPTSSRSARIDLSPEELSKLDKIAKQHEKSAKKYRRAQTLLAAYRGDTSSAIAKSFAPSPLTIQNTLKLFREEGLTRALRDLPKGPLASQQKKSEQHLIAALPYSETEGWALHTDGKQVSLESFALTTRGIPRKGATPIESLQSWAIPKENPEYAFQFEDIVTLYEKRPNESNPVLCYTEISLYKETRAEGEFQLKAEKPSKASELESIQLGIFIQPATGLRWIGIISKGENFFTTALAGLREHFSKAPKFHLVANSPSQELLGSLYKHMSPQEAREYLQLLEIHQTPKNGSWLNLADLEGTALAQRLCSQQIRNETDLAEAIFAWVKDRIEKQVGVNWQLAIDRGREAFTRVYTSTTQSK